MSQTTDITDDSDGGAQPDGTAEGDTGPSGVPGLLGRVPRLGVWAWSFVGFVVAAIIVCIALGAVSEIVLPMTFAAVLAVIFKPLVGALQRHKVKPSLAAGLVVLGLLALMVGVVVATVRGVTEQTDEISASADAAMERAGGADRRARYRSGRTGRSPGGNRGRRPDDHHRRPLRVGLRHRRSGRGGQRRDPRRAHHVLPAQGRHPPPALRRRTGRPHVPGRGRRLHR